MLQILHPSFNVCSAMHDLQILLLNDTLETLSYSPRLKHFSKIRWNMSSTFTTAPSGAKLKMLRIRFVEQSVGLISKTLERTCVEGDAWKTISSTPCSGTMQWGWSTVLFSHCSDSVISCTIIISSFFTLVLMVSASSQTHGRANSREAAAENKRLTKTSAWT